MTDRVRTLTVVLKEDTREDDVEEIAAAIRMLAPVDSVELGAEVDLPAILARSDARRALGEQLWSFMRGDNTNRKKG